MLHSLTKLVAKGLEVQTKVAPQALVKAKASQLPENSDPLYVVLRNRLWVQRSKVNWWLLSGRTATHEYRRENFGLTLPPSPKEG